MADRKKIKIKLTKEEVEQWKKGELALVVQNDKCEDTLTISLNWVEH